MTNTPDPKFDRLVKEKVNKLMSEFYSKLEDDSQPITFAQEESDRLFSLLTETHNSNTELNNSFFKVLEIKRPKKKLTYSEVIKEYYKKSPKKQRELLDFAATIFSLKEARSLIDAEKNKMKQEILKPTSALKSLTVESEKTDFTIARKVLIMSFLMTDVFENNIAPDKTDIARFLESLFGNKPASENISNTNLYDRVKSLFFDQAQANSEDLLYVKNKFRDLGMIQLESRIDTLLKAKKKSNP